MGYANICNHPVDRLVIKKTAKAAKKILLCLKESLPECKAQDRAYVATEPLTVNIRSPNLDMTAGSLGNTIGLVPAIHRKIR
jgi:hypothetical protein